MSEKQTRSVLSLEVKQFIKKTKKNNPQMSSRQLAEELLLKFDIKTSKSVICRTLESRDDIMSLKMENDASKKRKHILSKERCDFENRLDSRLRKMVKWLNRLPEDNCPKKWDKIQGFVGTIWTTEEEFILQMEMK